jgi:hypothetical protein
LKEKVIALVVLSLIVFGIAANAVMIDKSIDATLKEVEKLSFGAGSSAEDAERIYSDFKVKENYISITVNHEDLTNINECFSDMIAYLRVGKRDEAEVAKYRLIDSLEHLRRSCGLNVDSII